MSLDLDDLKRLKITAETRAWLESERLTTGKSKQDIAREALHQIAVQKIHAAKVLAALAPAEANSGDTRGRPR